jgi:hypothetical protein
MPDLANRIKHAEVIQIVHHQLQEALASYPTETVLAYARTLRNYIDDLLAEGKTPPIDPLTAEVAKHFEELKG